MVGPVSGPRRLEGASKRFAGVGVVPRAPAQGNPDDNYCLRRRPGGLEHGTPPTQPSRREPGNIAAAGGGVLAPAVESVRVVGLTFGFGLPAPGLSTPRCRPAATSRSSTAERDLRVVRHSERGVATADIQHMVLGVVQQVTQ